MTTSLQEQKRDYLRRAVDRLKAEKGMTQRSIAEAMEETEQELSGKLSLKSQRTITDDYIDQFAKWSGIPFTTGEPGGVTQEQVEELLLQGKTTARLLSAVMDRLEGKTVPKPEHQ